MTGLATSEESLLIPGIPSPRNRFIKVKRRADESPLPLLLLEEEGRTLLYLLSSSTSKPAGDNHKSTVPVDVLLSELKNSGVNAKRPRVEAIPIRLSLRSLYKRELLDGDGDDGAYDYYIQRDPARLQQVSIEDYDKIGVITSFQELEFASDGEHDLDILGDDDSDSNAEDYYTNDYPDEEEYCVDEDEGGVGRCSTEDDDEFECYDRQDDYDHDLAPWKMLSSPGWRRMSTSDSDRWLYRSTCLSSDEEVQ